VIEAVFVGVIPDDLAVVIDASCMGAIDNAGAAGIAGKGVVDSGEEAAAINKAMIASGIRVIPDDLAQIVDAPCHGGGGQRIVEGGESAAAFDEAMNAVVGGPVPPDDLARGVDALWVGTLGA
jgi:hypothetical protein